MRRPSTPALRHAGFRRMVRALLQEARAADEVSSSGDPRGLGCFILCPHVCGDCDLIVRSCRCLARW